MVVINNLQQFHAAIAAVCPIDGVDASGFIFFDPAATPAQIQAANNVAASYTDVPPQPASTKAILARLTTAEYTAIVNIANSRLASANPDVHRFFWGQEIVDLSQAGPQALITALVTAGVLTSARANAIFNFPAATNNPPPVQPSH